MPEPANLREQDGCWNCKYCELEYGYNCTCTEKHGDNYPMSIIWICDYWKKDSRWGKKKGIAGKIDEEKEHKKFIGRYKKRMKKNRENRTLYWKPTVLPWESASLPGFQLGNELKDIFSFISHGDSGNIGEYDFSIYQLDWLRGIGFGVDTPSVKDDVEILDDALRQWSEITVYED